jgi:bacterioferritin-associated ferredoxin
MYVCSCRQINERAVQGAGRAGILTPLGLAMHFGLNDPEACGRCLDELDLFVDLALAGVEAEPEVAAT